MGRREKEREETFNPARHRGRILMENTRRLTGPGRIHVSNEDTNEAAKRRKDTRITRAERKKNQLISIQDGRGETEEKNCVSRRARE